MLFLLSLPVALGKFFILSDIHYDIEYDPNSNSTSSCHSDSNSLNSSPSYVQSFCDSSYSLILSTLSQMQVIDPNPEFILITGDLLAHSTMNLVINGVLDQERNRQIVHLALQNLSETLIEFFPNTQVLPTIGNNDAYNHYYMPEGHFKYEYLNFMYTLWQKHGNISSTFITDGYYSVHTTSEYTVICLNTLFFSYKQEIDIRGKIQLIWLKSELENNENIIISMHIPPGFSLYQGGYQSWHDYYIEIFVDLIESYSAKIKAIYAGHFHSGYFELIADRFIIIHPSISPFFGNNPGFRYYDLDQNNFFEYALNSKNLTQGWQKSSFIDLFGYKVDYLRVFNELNQEILEFSDFIMYATGNWINGEDYSIACKTIFDNICYKGKAYLLDLALCGFSKLKSVDFLKCSNSFR